MSLWSWLWDGSDAETGSHTVSWWADQPVTTVDPSILRMADTPVDRRYVERYRRHPNARADDGDPCVVITKSGVHELRNGKHRATAALEEGRQLRVRVVDERSSSGSWWW